MKTKLFFLALWLFAISCNNDDRMSDSTIIPQTKYSYDLSKNLILIKGKKSDVKNLVYSEKSSFLENSYENYSILVFYAITQNPTQNPKPKPKTQNPKPKIQNPKPN